MSSETKNILIKGANVIVSSADANTENVKTLYNTYAKKLLAYTLKNYTISKDDAWTVVYKVSLHYTPSCSLIGNSLCNSDFLVSGNFVRVSSNQV